MSYPQAIYDRTASCKGCLFAQDDGLTLACHAEPPARDSAESPSGATWPIVDPDAWCGRFLPRKAEA